MKSRRTLKQVFCRHHREFISKNTIVNEVLSKCDKCGVYEVWHRGINCSYQSKEFPTNKGWGWGNK